MVRALLLALALLPFAAAATPDWIKMEFKAESFNMTNTPKFSNPAANVGSMSLNSDGTVRALNNFSSITSTLPNLAAPSERQYRFGLRLEFQTETQPAFVE